MNTRAAAISVAGAPGPWLDEAEAAAAFMKRG
jgi:hypothetical protein